MASAAAYSTNDRTGEAQFLQALVAAAIIDASSASRVASAGAKTGEAYCRLLPRLGLIEEAPLAQHLSQHLGLPLLQEQDIPSLPVGSDALSDRFLHEALALPLHMSETRLLVAVADPFAEHTLQALNLASGRTVEFVIGQLTRIEQALRRLYESDGKPPAFAVADSTADEDGGDIQRLKDLAAEAPVIREVNQMIRMAVELRASDIHLEPLARDLKLRLRIDGILHDVTAPAATMRQAIVSRIKVMARLNIAERRLPQDGRIRLSVLGKEVDLRVSTFPTMYGESVVLRILDRFAIDLDIHRLGLGAAELQKYLKALHRPTGTILITGPTGSGKTTTLYASLLHLNSNTEKIFTIEDPIEYELTGINQTQVKPQIGLTFAQALRSLMRQDPDIILIGEIRDLETAETAGQASLTGHKVLSTLHTNDAVSAITRLRDMGVPTFLVSATLTCVVAQRLVRVLCPHCKQASDMPVQLKALVQRHQLDLTRHTALCMPAGCARCNGSGYSGRTAIYEVLEINDALRELMHRDASTADLRTAAKAQGLRSMHADGLSRILEGLTTLEEVQRVTSEV